MCNQKTKRLEIASFSSSNKASFCRMVSVGLTLMIKCACFNAEVEMGLELECQKGVSVSVCHQVQCPVLTPCVQGDIINTVFNIPGIREFLK
jgi:hypothetical protein